jgi:hypothetical protein
MREYQGQRLAQAEPAIHGAELTTFMRALLREARVRDLPMMPGSGMAIRGHTELPF